MYRSIKRFFDLCVAFILLLLLSPLFIIITVFLFVANDGHPFFVQSRPGKKEKIFNIIKFKTMNDKKDAKGNLLSDGERLTKVGSIVRRTSLDEIPQLINVIKGEMSFIGPRPLLVRYLPYYSKNEKVRHTVRPGITGLAQVSGRNLISWDRKLEMDVYYVQNQNMIMDLSIFFKTIKKVIFSEDVVADAQTIMLPLDEERDQKNK